MNNSVIPEDNHLDLSTCPKILEQEMLCEHFSTLITSIGRSESLCCESFESLLVAGADVNVADTHGRTALMMASGNKELMKRLLREGASVNRSSNHGTTPLMSAVLNSCEPEVTQSLITAGADVNATDVNSMSALAHAALVNGGYQNVKLLLQHGALVNVENVCGQNVLEHYLAVCGNLGDEIVHLLHSAGERLDPKNVKRNAWMTNWSHLDMNITSLVRDCPLEDNINGCLKCRCRTALRDHLISVDTKANLFQRVPKLGLPTKLAHFLVYDI